MASRHKILTAAGLSLAFAVAGCGGSDDESASTSAKPATTTARKVDIESFKYVPPTLTVRANSTVTFTNRDRAGHTATSDKPGAFDTGALNRGDSKPVRLSAPGRYAYHCDFHPFMHGVVVVQ